MGKVLPLLVLSVAGSCGAIAGSEGGVLCVIATASLYCVKEGEIALALALLFPYALTYY